MAAFTGIETNNKFVLTNALGQKMLYAAEDTECCMRICCGKSRGFTYRVFDNANNVASPSLTGDDLQGPLKEVMNVIREFKCCSGCCWCANSDHCAFLVRVEAPPGISP